MINISKIYLALYGAYSFFWILDYSALDLAMFIKIFGLICSFMCIALFLYVHFQKKMDLYRLGLMLVILILITIGCLLYKRYNLLVVISFIFSASDVVDFDSIVKTSARSTILATAFVVIACLMGYIEDYVFIHRDNVGHSFGFTYYTSIHFIFLFVSCMMMYLSKKGLTWRALILLTAFNILLYYYGTAALPFVVFFIIEILYIVLVKWDWFNFSKKPIIFTSCFLFPISTLLMFYFTHSYGNGQPWAILLNKALNGRLNLSFIGLQKYGITLLGQQIDMVGNTQIYLGEAGREDYFFIDSAYVYIVICYGVLIAAALLLMYSLIFYRACKQNDKKMIIWMVCLLVFSFVNNAIIYIAYNPLLLGLLLKPNRQGQSDEDRSLGKRKILFNIRK